MKFFYFFSSLLFISFSFSQSNVGTEVDEASLFGSKENATISSTTLSTNPAGKTYPEIRFGGDIVSSVLWSVRRGVETNNYSWSNNYLVPSLQGNLNFDARVAENFRAHLGTSLLYQPLNPTNQLTFSLKEFFVDYNLFNFIYLRGGKQVLAWGRGYFWTPTDLINIEKQDILNREQVREGAYGVRLHIPYKTYFNLYSFLNAGATLNYEKFAISVKAEVLLGPVEIAVSYLGRQRRLPVYGFDFSSGLGGWNLYGEALLAFESQNDRLQTNTNAFLPPVAIGESNVFTKAMIGISKSFDQNRFSFGLECYYNGEGYSESAFENSNLKPYLLKGRGFQSLDYGKWYVATYLNRSELFNKTTTLGLVAIANLTDQSLQLSPSLSISPFDNFSATLRIPFFIGNVNKEFTVADQLAYVQIDLRYRF